MTAARYQRHDPEAPDDRELVEAQRPAPTVQFYGGGVGYGRGADLREAVERLAALLDEALAALNALRADCPVQTPAVGWHRLAAIGARVALKRWRAALDGEAVVADLETTARVRFSAEAAAQLASKLRATAAAHETYGPKNGRKARADGLRWAARIVEREALPGGE